ncbi:MAG: monovalent cation/H+ antiporter subunit D family protein [Alphaproteobacteria bacterium]|nr:monovalent cation/H+ antiporter subunit D family protein [Alphaproteobacteria bacterium]
MVALGALLAPLLATLVPAVAAGGRPRLELVELAPGVPLVFELEPLGLVYALVAASLWPVTALYGVGYLRGHHEHHQTRFFVFFSASISAALGIAFAGNLATLFVFYEVLSLSTWPLVTHHQDEEARRAGRVYLGILMSTSIGLLLLAIVWTWSATGELAFRPGGILDGHVDDGLLPVLLGLYAFGAAKAGLMPVHRWLPNAMVAPTPVSALLHAVAVVKAGVFTILKVVIYVFGLDLLTRTGASIWLMWAAAFTILAASLVALTKDHLKERLAYSTIGQLAYIVLGAALATPDGLLGGGLHIVMHAAGKITLFFCAGAIMVATHRKKVSELVGLGRYMPWTFAAFFVGSLSVIGLPPAGGSWSKWFLGTGALQAHQPALVAVLMISSLLNIAYLMDVVGKAFFLPPPDTTVRAGYREASTLTLVPPLITAGLSLLLFLGGAQVVELLRPVVGGVP